jgi:aminopeptidase
LVVRQDTFEAYARLIVEVGINLEPGQLFGVTAYVEHAPLVRAITRAAYAQGARHVDVQYLDEEVRKATIEAGPDEMLGWTPPWMLERRRSYERAGYLIVRGHPDPHLFDGVDGERLARSRRRDEDALWLRQVTDRVVNWCIVCCPTEGWAKTVFGEPDVDRLWDAVLRTVRLDEDDPPAAWRSHVERLQRRATALNERRFDGIRFRGPGTDLTVGLHPTSRWQSAEDETVWGLRHVPNLPTEEVYTTPDYRRTEGVVRSTRPLFTSGTIVAGLEMRFAGGRVQEVKAERGAEVVRTQMATDEGAGVLGEIALVDGSSRVGQIGLTFFETLFDENATSHVAYGQGFAGNVDGAEVLSGEEQWERGIAQSSQHTDFMVGGPEVEVDGLSPSGEAVALLRDDTWQLDH